MVDWDQWQTLLAVFRTGTYSQAAKSIGVDATTVGRRIKLLEKRLGYQLFLRQNSRLFPSTDCEALLSHIETASEALRAAEHKTAISDSGAIWRDLRLTAPPFLVRNIFAPGVKSLTDNERIRIEFQSGEQNVSLSRRESDILIRIEDKVPDFQFETDQIETEQIGVLEYAVYCRSDIAPTNLPWAGLKESYIRTSGSKAMFRLTEGKGFQFRAFNFDGISEIVACGAARAMLPCVSTDQDERLKRVSDVVLRQPLWMLFHSKDADVRHIKSTCEWIRSVVNQHLPENP